MIQANKNELTPTQFEGLLYTLKMRFEKNMNRHTTIEWSNVANKLKANSEKLGPLFRMEETGGEPDVIGYDEKTDEYHFCDCSDESPKGRRSFCYDHEALNSRKEHKPKDSVMNMATDMGIEILSEEQYQELQKLGNFDAKTSSWLKTPMAVRKLGGAIFADFRYNRVFIGHNGADSYYAARGFRGLFKV